MNVCVLDTHTYAFISISLDEKIIRSRTSLLEYCWQGDGSFQKANHSIHSNNLKAGECDFSTTRTMLIHLTEEIRFKNNEAYLSKGTLSAPPSSNFGGQRPSIHYSLRHRHDSSPKRSCSILMSSKHVSSAFSFSFLVSSAS